MQPPTDRNSGNTNSNGQQNLCIKCKAKPPISSASAAGGGDDARFCAECFRNILYGKFRLAVTSHSMITPSDNVLVAFSGGPASRLMKLLSVVNDATGKEDIPAASASGGLAKGLAKRRPMEGFGNRSNRDIIFATWFHDDQGQGYSLSADIQYVDARWEIPVVLPLRDCTAQELKLLCCIDGLLLSEGSVLILAGQSKDFAIN
ncbi:hypothetical protein GH714_035975 [Hevea brasiliensis]|uniref:Cytoplasmic tRNA 2-thiolation protein 2 n=1 Tax=Hevea brasiliensis TaxID=3981 RepID=A0A6A6KN09_HEVBR|nr:hypothetical protein GH714_035975 [Hevea brasiliensis]